MDSDRFLPVEVLAKFPKVMSLTRDTSQVVEALRSSSKVEVSIDDLFVRPKHVLLVTLILRYIPDDVLESELRALFQDSPVLASKIVSMKPFAISNWAVGFSSEQACSDALKHVTTKSLRDRPVVAIIQAFVPASDAMRNRRPHPARSRSQNITRKLREDDFPPLPSSSSTTSTSSTTTTATGPSSTITAPCSNVTAPALPTESKAVPQFVKYTREQMAEIVAKLSKLNLPMPDGYQSVQDSTIIRTTPQRDTILLDPIPIMFPASPSPETAFMIPKAPIPFLDLNSGLSPPLAASALPELPKTSAYPDLSTLSCLSSLSNLSELNNFSMPSTQPSSFSSVNMPSTQFIQPLPISPVPATTSQPIKLNAKEKEKPNTSTRSSASASSATTKGGQRNSQNSSKVSSSTNQVSNPRKNRANSPDRRSKTRHTSTSTRHSHALPVVMPTVFPEVPTTNGYAKYPSPVAQSQSQSQTQASSQGTVPPKAPWGKLNFADALAKQPSADEVERLKALAEQKIERRRLEALKLSGSVPSENQVASQATKTQDGKPVKSKSNQNSSNETKVASKTTQTQAAQAASVTVAVKSQNTPISTVVKAESDKSQQPQQPQPRTWAKLAAL